MYRIITNTNKEDIQKDMDVLQVIKALVKANPSLHSLIAHYIGSEMLSSDSDKTFSDKLKAFRDDVLINPGELDRMHCDFKKHYLNEDIPSDEIFKDIRLNWTELAEDMYQARQPVSVAYKFIHRFDGTNWYLTAQQQQLAKYGDIDKFTSLGNGNGSMFDIGYTGNMYEVDGTDLCTDINGHYYDTHYQKAIKGYDSTDGTGTAYADNSRVWSAILPAQELRLVIHHNLIFGGNESDFQVNFKSITYDTSGDTTGMYKVNFPHCIALYASCYGSAILQEGAVIAGAVFRGKGANLDSLCPPNCNKYYWPKNLPA